MHCYGDLLYIIIMILMVMSVMTMVVIIMMIVVAVMILMISKKMTVTSKKMTAHHRQGPVSFLCFHEFLRGMCSMRLPIVSVQKMKQELDQKRDVLKKLELELGNAERWNDQISQSFHKCDVDLSRYREQVTQMSDRWRRIQSQIDSRSERRAAATPGSLRHLQFMCVSYN